MTEAQKLNNIGSDLCKAGYTERGLAEYLKAIASDPDYARAKYNAASAMADLGRDEDAVEMYKLTLQLNPRHAKALVNLSATLLGLDRPHEAAEFAKRATEVNPDNPHAWNNLGSILSAIGVGEWAKECFERATQLLPGNASMHVNLGIELLRHDEYRKGWAEYNWRLADKKSTWPMWDFTPLNGRTLLLQCEQGFGDTLQFIRYVSMISGGFVCLDCPAEFKALFSRLRTADGYVELIHPGKARPAIDVYCPLMRLAMLFCMNSVKDVLSSKAYLSASEDKKQLWKDTLGRTAGKKVGIIWQGNPRFGNKACGWADRKRSIPAKHFLSLRSEKVKLYSLQKGYGEDGVSCIDGVTKLGEFIKDFSDTAAIMANMDLIISCDSAPCHLAGALGAPVWTALPYVACWRWGLDRNCGQDSEDTPWYPSMRLFRQKMPGDWEGVFTKIKEALHALN